MSARPPLPARLGVHLAMCAVLVSAASLGVAEAIRVTGDAMGIRLPAWGVAIAAILVAAAPAALYLASLASLVEKLGAFAAALSRGETVGAAPGATRGDELGLLARSLAQGSRGDIDSLRARLALEACPTNVMIVDEHNIIRFMNEAVTKLFHEHASDFRVAVPGFNPASIIGQSMGVFHRNPAHQDRMVSQLSGSHVSRVKIGRRTFDLAVSPVKDASGQRLGAMLEWRDMTAELAAQEEVAAVAKAAAAGDFSGRVPLEGKAGFMRDLAAAMNEIGAGVDRATTELAGAMSALAQGDLTRSIQTDYQGRFGELKDALNETISHLSQTVGTLQTTAEDVGSAAREIASGASDLSLRTEQQASSLEQTAATTEELAASVKASAQSSRQAVELADQAMAVASDGGGIVREAVEAMARIEQASQKISDITGVIDEIAFQTNLLALNAAVEAARAGDAGKGFAVVASEVRTLAQRSSEAAKDITGLINASGAEVAQGVKLVRGAGEALEKIVQASQRVSATVSEISAATGEQANGIDEMSQAVAHMDEMTQQNAALAEESAASAGSLTTQIQRLEELVGGFRTSGRPARRSESSEPVSAPSRTASRAPAPVKRPVRPDAAPAHAAAPKTEPDRLRKLAEDAFAGRPPAARPAAAKAPARAPAPPPRRAAAGSDNGWEEF